MDEGKGVKVYRSKGHTRLGSSISVIKGGSGTFTLSGSIQLTGMFRSVSDKCPDWRLGTFVQCDTGERLGRDLDRSSVSFRTVDVGSRRVGPDVSKPFRVPKRGGSLYLLKKGP